MSDNWCRARAADLGRGIGAGRIDPRALTDAYLEAIAAHPDAARIYARTTPERARAEAAAAAGRARTGTRRGPLDGVPISWKDLFDTAGTATEAGSALLAGRVPVRDAVCLAEATRAGLVTLGKTHMTELAFSGLGINPVTATPPNVNAPDCAPGGSSSGAAASVAFGLAAGAIGSDTGGSVRVPAAWNDLVGFKTTAGRISLGGVVPLCPRFDSIGPLCRSVEDASLLYAALTGGPATDLDGARLSGLRLAVLDTAPLGATAPEIATAFATALDRIGAAGASLVPLTLSCVAQAFDTAPAVFAGEAYATWGARIEADPEAMYPPVRERFRGGRDVTATAYLRAWTDLEALRAEYAAATASFDAVLLPSTPNLPPPVAALLADTARFNAENLAALRNTRIGNLMGLAALTLPTGTPSCGIMVLAAGGAEARLLRIGAATERALA